MEINILIEEDFKRCLEADWLHRIVEQSLTVQDIDSEVEVSLVITTQENIQKLNRMYRGINKPTDVLSFYMIPAVGGAKVESSSFVVPPDGVRHLGEVIISYPQAVIQSQEQKHSVKKEITVLVIHGVLHLLGFEHDTPEQERRMKAKETMVLSQIEEGSISDAGQRQ
jgi:probable rRNA maturation factor